ncbi:MAG: hypothetical protein AB8B83_07020, partial [Bdellovibrionales bacterium]
ASGLNQAIDRSGTDSVMQIYCMMQLKALNALNPDLLYVAKPNGDEITTIISGDVTPRDVQTALDRARDHFDVFLGAAGLKNLEHAREGRQAGVKNASAFQEISHVNADPETLECIISDLHKGPIAHEKDHSAQADGVSIDNFKSNTDARRFSAALAEFHPNLDVASFIKVDPDIAPLSEQERKAINSISTEHTRTQRKKALEDVQASKSHVHSLIRFDVHSLNQLNTDIGKDQADCVIDVVQSVIKKYAHQVDPHFQSFEVDSRCLDVLVKVSGSDLERLKLEIYKAISELDLPSVVDAVPIMIASVPIQPERNYDVMMQRLGDTLGVNKHHGVSLFHKSGGDIVCFGFDGQSTAVIDNHELNSDGSIPFARSACALLSDDTVSATFLMRIGELMRFVNGDDFEGVLKRHVIIKDLIDQGVVERDDVIAQLEQSPQMQDLDCWLEQYTHQPLKAHSSAGISDAERVMTQAVEISSGEMAGRWMPSLLGMAKDEYVFVKETCMQAQSCFRTMGDLEKQSSDLASDRETAKSKLLNDIQTRMPHIPDKDSRFIQSVEQAVRALHFISALHGEELSNDCKALGLGLVRQALDKAGRNFQNIGNQCDQIADFMRVKAYDIGIDFDCVDANVHGLHEALMDAILSVYNVFDDPTEQQKFRSNMHAIIEGISVADGPGLDFDDKLDI